MKLAQSRVLVTGAGSGLGAQTARHFAGQGAKVVLLDHDIDKARQVADEIGGQAVQANVSDEAAVGRALDEASAHLGGAPRVIVNCAGVGFAARIVGREGKLSFDTFEKTLKVNLFGTFNVMSHAARRLLDEDPTETGERGVIINTASVAFEDGQLGQAAYSASKGGIAAMCLPAAREFAQHGIRVMAIAPGLFRTPMMEGLPEEVSAKITANIPFPPRLGEPDEFARLAEHIVSNPFLNGTTIRLDGAVRLPPR
ncbi:SDR family NAD(P)-dependent oxidoreductase [Labrenzia sp. VG12]|uniref:SDR family NAD(P)-dependent oxidoreductase n=1 Tax=Labrenzia sp. VG12 TaxID=2021862 RepID=UPI000B8BC70E|nr:SDR family NAD(P)-dependent oxidoreductase [Labrenzia sp. VG12]ASP34259.1 3-hydroxyacyl-CoA dehydrogenase [Labrenzia sp. VG12]